MKQIVLILLFIFTLQKRLPTDSSKDLPKGRLYYKSSSFSISPSQECPEGYYKHCFVKGMYRGTSKLPYQCRCYEKPTPKVNRILKEVRTTNKPTNGGSIKEKYSILLGRKLHSVQSHSPRCNGDFYVCYVLIYTNKSRLDCHCSKTPR